jgi:hypothetical protein
MIRTCLKSRVRGALAAMLILGAAGLGACASEDQARYLAVEDRGDRLEMPYLGSLDGWAFFLGELMWVARVFVGTK